MHYLAYGSNLHPLRLILRVPGARCVGVCRLRGCRLVFGKRSVDGSAKCTLAFTGKAADTAHGAVFDLPDREIPLLDEAEGLGAGYDKQRLVVAVAGVDLDVFTYIASATHRVVNLAPYHWYKGFVLAGARRHGFPADYLQKIAAVASMPDPDGRRRAQMEALLVQLEG